LVDKSLLHKRAIIETVKDQIKKHSANRAYPAPQRGERHGQCPGRFSGLYAPTAQTVTEYLKNALKLLTC
jgi:hypothetical protein